MSSHHRFFVRPLPELITVLKQHGNHHIIPYFKNLKGPYYSKWQIKDSFLLPVSLWQNSFHWILGRFSLGRFLPPWLARPFGWFLWTRDPLGTRSCAVPSARSSGLGLEEVVSPDRVPDCRPGCAPQTPVYLQKHPGSWWALWDSNWNHQSPWAERQADSSRPLSRRTN